MSKSALVGLTKGLARDLGPKGITINNVQPGPVDTDMNPADGDFADSLIPLMAWAVMASRRDCQFRRLPRRPRGGLHHRCEPDHRWWLRRLMR
jgi:NAD(P)-dependent dehydrogenase (short-subunit alcohol dehydrogenase family)